MWRPNQVEGRMKTVFVELDTTKRSETKFPKQKKIASRAVMVDCQPSNKLQVFTILCLLRTISCSRFVKAL